jgi:hypothetical protein
VLLERKAGRDAVFRVRLDRLNHQIELVCAVDLPEGAIDLVRCDHLGFREVVQAVSAVGVAILHDKHEAGTAFRLGEQDEVVGAEVEHDGMTWSVWGRDRCRSRPIRSAVVGLARRTPPVAGVIITERRLTAGRGLLLFRCRLLLPGFADTRSAEQEDLRVLDQPVGNGGGDRCIEQDVAPFREW